MVRAPILILQRTMTPSIGDVTPPGSWFNTGSEPMVAVSAAPVTEAFAVELRLLPKVTTAPA